MSTSSSSPTLSLAVSNKQFQIDGLKRNIQYQICLSTSRNPDFVLKYPNELKSKNQDWKKEIIKRVTREEEVRQKMLAVRLLKQTGVRRYHE